MTETLSPDQLRLVGQAIWGDHWQAELSRAWNVSDRSVRRWLSGERPFPADRVADLRTLCADRIAEIQQAVTALDQSASL